MAKITYARLAVPYIVVQNHNGQVTTFGESLAYSAFLQGCLAIRKGGVDIEVYDEDGILVVGDFSAKETPVVAVAAKV